MVPELAETYPNYSEGRLMQIAAGIWDKEHPRGYMFDPDHLADLIADITALRQEMIKRDRWIDKRYGALEPEYGEMAARGEYHPAIKRRRRQYFYPEQWERGIERIRESGYHPRREEYRMLREHVRGSVKSMEEAQRELMDPAVAREIRGSGSRLFRTGLGVARRGARLGRQLRTLRRPQLRRPMFPRTKLPTPRQPSTPQRTPRKETLRYIADPARLTKPDDYPGYDNLNFLRIVEAATKKGYHPVKRLMEGQIVLPAHQWDRVHAQVKEWPDIAVTDENKDDQPDRIIRRGHDNYQTNLFVDRA